MSVLLFHIFQCMTIRRIAIGIDIELYNFEIEKTARITILFILFAVVYVSPHHKESDSLHRTDNIDDHLTRNPEFLEGHRDADKESLGTMKEN